jgi:hypothetical protein
LKLSGSFKYRSAARDAVLRAICKRPGWVRDKTIAAEVGKTVEAVRKQLQRLRAIGLLDYDGNGRYRWHKKRKQRELKPCSSKSIPKCRGTDRERKMLSRTELVRRGWPRCLIEELFHEAGKDYIEKEIDLSDTIGRVVKAPFYWVSRIRAIESQTWFETERAKILRHPRQSN